VRDNSGLLWSLLAIQTMCTAFFLADALGDLLFHTDVIPEGSSDVFELIVVLVLIGSTGFTALQVRRVMQRHKHVESQLRAASGAFAEIVDEHFDTWALSEAERDVALLLIKGLSIAEIAALRETKDGTIKAQSNAIYRKSGVAGRAQLVSLFIEKLMADSITNTRQAS
jgi:DNA-binding NarL/FixJ family response regulator